MFEVDLAEAAEKCISPETIVALAKQKISMNEIDFSVLDVLDVSKEERAFFKCAYPKVDAVASEKLHCTSCNRHIGATASRSTIAMHPILRVTMCRRCVSFYNRGNFSVDEDGSDMYCRWCGQGGNVYCCSDCPYVFCRNCIVRNYSVDTLNKIINADAWRCFTCNPSVLWPLRAKHWALSNYCEMLKVSIMSMKSSNDSYEFNKALRIDASVCCSMKQRRNSRRQSKPPISRPIDSPDPNTDGSDEDTLKQIRQMFDNDDDDDSDAIATTSRTRKSRTVSTSSSSSSSSSASSSSLLKPMRCSPKANRRSVKINTSNAGKKSDRTKSKRATNERTLKRIKQLLEKDDSNDDDDRNDSDANTSNRSMNVQKRKRAISSSESESGSSLSLLKPMRSSPKPKRRPVINDESSSGSLTRDPGLTPGGSAVAVVDKPLNTMTAAAAASSTSLLRAPKPTQAIRNTSIVAEESNPIYHIINGYKIDLKSASQLGVFRLPNGKYIQVRRSELPSGFVAASTAGQPPTAANAKTLTTAAGTTSTTTTTTSTKQMNNIRTSIYTQSPRRAQYRNRHRSILPVPMQSETPTTPLATTQTNNQIDIRNHALLQTEKIPNESPSTKSTLAKQQSENISTNSAPIQSTTPTIIQPQSIATKSTATQVKTTTATVATQTNNTIPQQKSTPPPPIQSAESSTQQLPAQKTVTAPPPTPPPPVRIESIEEVRMELKTQIGEAQTCYLLAIRKLNSLSNSNAFKTAATYMHFKELHSDMAYLFKYTLGRIDELQRVCADKMELLQRANDEAVRQANQTANYRDADDDLEILEPTQTCIEIDSAEEDGAVAVDEQRTAAAPTTTATAPTTTATAPTTTATAPTTTTANEVDAVTAVAAESNVADKSSSSATTTLEEQNELTLLGRKQRTLLFLHRKKLREHHQRLRFKQKRFLLQKQQQLAQKTGGAVEQSTTNQRERIFLIRDSERGSSFLATIDDSAMLSLVPNSSETISEATTTTTASAEQCATTSSAAAATDKQPHQANDKTINNDDPIDILDSDDEHDNMITVYMQEDDS